MSKLQIFPQQKKRVESGPIRFGDDWPGVFLRGDNALIYAYHLRSVIQYITETQALNDVSVSAMAVLSGLADDLESCHIKRHM